MSAACGALLFGCACLCALGVRRYVPYYSRQRILRRVRTWGCFGGQRIRSMAQQDAAIEQADQISGTHSCSKASGVGAKEEPGVELVR